MLAEMDLRAPDPRRAAPAAQAPLPRLSGQRHVLRGRAPALGFHEDGLLSALAVAAALGCCLDGATEDA